MIISHFPDVDNGRVFTLSNYALFSRRTSANEFSEDSAYRYNLSEEDLHKIQQLFKSKVIKRQRGYVKGLYTFPIRGVEGWYSAKMYLQNSEESKVYGEILTLDSFSIEEWCLLLKWMDRIHGSHNKREALVTTHNNKKVQCVLYAEVLPDWYYITRVANGCPQRNRFASNFNLIFWYSAHESLIAFHMSQCSKHNTYIKNHKMVFNIQNPSGEGRANLIEAEDCIVIGRLLITKDLPLSTFDNACNNASHRNLFESHGNSCFYFLIRSSSP
jgi:hypothetical protein